MQECSYYYKDAKALFNKYNTNFGASECHIHSQNTEELTQKSQFCCKTEVVIFTSKNIMKNKWKSEYS